jgi:hypothetical protein
METDLPGPEPTEFEVTPGDSDGQTVMEAIKPHKKINQVAAKF